MMRALRVATLVLAAVACSDDDPAPAAIDDARVFLAAAVDADCEALVRCGSFASHDQCVAYRTDHRDYFTDGLPPPLAFTAVYLPYLDRGTVSYAPRAAAVCVEALRDRDCSSYASLEACRSIFTGRAADGATTTASLECQTATWIESECSDDGSCCSGTCFASTAPTAVGIGARCDEPAPAADEGGTICYGGLTCERGRCVGPAAGEPCFDDAQCRDGLVCGDVCQEPDAIGERCMLNGGGRSTCRGGTFCGSDNTCHRYPLAGDDCGATAGICAPGLLCDAQTSTCVGFLGAGEACATAGALPACAIGLFCDDLGPSSICAAKRPDGADCGADFQCASNLCTDQACGFAVDRCD